ncbi:MAG: SRPBCC family protein [Chloroflexi bacterium]|nr:SRPBCC family protein [Chloroflexota bacterium]
MALDVSATLRIERTADDVADYATNPAHDTVWIGGIKQARMLTDPPVRIGTQVERVAHFMGRRVEYVLEVVGLDAGRRLEMASVKAPFPMRVTYGFELDREATIVSIRVQGGPDGLMGLLSPVMAMGVRRNISGDLRRLKRVLEGV